MGDSSNPNVQQAEELKLRANDVFKANMFSQAINLYDQAIDLNSSNAVYWANRAFAHMKLEEYRSAVQDATKAIEIDPKYSKGYYRRGAAYLAMGKFKVALKDFQQVKKKICPNDPDATRKLKECEKAVQKIRFEEAISVGDTERRSIADSLDYHIIEVEPQYIGARIDGDTITLYFIKQMLDDFKNKNVYIEGMQSKLCCKHETCCDQCLPSALLTAATEGFSLPEGVAVHALSLKSGLEVDLSVSNALIGFYAEHGISVEDVVGVFQRMPVNDVISCTGLLNGYMEFGLVDKALSVFDRMPERNFVTYNAVLTGFCQNKEGARVSFAKKAGLRGLGLFRQMLEKGLDISDVTVTGVLNSRAIAADRKMSEQVHTFVISVAVVQVLGLTPH